MKIPIKSKIRIFYLQIVNLLASFAPINKLSPKERKVLAELMYQNYRLRTLDEKTRHIVLLSTENRRDIQEYLGMSADTLYTYLCNLRRHKVLDKSNRLPTFLNRILPKDEYEFTILFKLDDNE